MVFDKELWIGRSGGNYERQIPADLRVIRLKSKPVPSSKGTLVKSVPELSRLIDERRPDVLYTVLIPPSVALYAARQRAGHQPKLIASLQATLSKKYNTAFYHSVNRWLVRRYYPRFDRIVSISKGVDDDLKLICGKGAVDSTVVYNAGYGPDRVDYRAPAKPEVTPRAPIRLIAAGRLVPQKGFPYLLEAVSLLKDLNFELTIIGEGPLRGAFEQTIEDLNIADKVLMPGFHDDPFSMYERAHIFVLSSLWEGFGNVIVEAMSCGAAVVSTDCEHGPGEIIRDGETGLLVPTADATALATAIRRLIENDGLRQRLAAAGQARSQDFSPYAIAAEYGQIFKRVVSG